MIPVLTGSEIHELLNAELHGRWRPVNSTRAAVNRRTAWCCCQRIGQRGLFRILGTHIVPEGDAIKCFVRWRSGDDR